MKSLTKLGFATVIALGAFAVSPAPAAAQTHNQRLENKELKAHEKQERAMYGNSGALRQHQRQEKGQFKAEERAERSGWYGGQYGGWPNGYPPPYRSGPYHNQRYRGWFGNQPYWRHGHH